MRNIHDLIADKPVDTSVEDRIKSLAKEVHDEAYTLGRTLAWDDFFAGNEENLANLRKGELPGEMCSKAEDVIVNGTGSKIIRKGLHKHAMAHDSEGFFSDLVSMGKERLVAGLKDRLAEHDAKLDIDLDDDSHHDA